MAQQVSLVDNVIQESSRYISISNFQVGRDNAKKEGKN